MRNMITTCSEEAEEGECQGIHLTLQPCPGTDYGLPPINAWREKDTLGSWSRQAALTVFAVRVLLFFRRTLLSTAWTEHRDPGAALRSRLTFDPGTSSLREKSSATCKRRQSQGAYCWRVGLCDSRVSGQQRERQRIR